MASRKSGSAPRFTSFRSQPPVDITDEEKRADLHSQSALPQCKPIRDKSHKKSSSSSVRRYDRHGVLAKVPGYSTSSHLPSSSSDGAFTVDLKGDLNNSRYATIDRYTIPKYRRVGGGSVMGVPKWQKIDRDSENRNIIELSATNYGRNVHGIRSMRVESGTPELRIRPGVSSGFPIGANDDFVAISEPKSKKRKLSSQGIDPAESDSSNQEKSELSNYSSEKVSRFIDRNSHGVLENQDLESSTLSDPKAPFPSGPGSVVMELNQRLRDNPKDAELWLNLASVSSQDQAVNDPRDEAKLRMSILEEGLRKVKDPIDREKLLLASMQAAEIALDVEHALHRWEDTVQKDQQSKLLRICHLRFLRTNFAAFRFNDYRDSALEALLNCNNVETDESDFMKEPATIWDILLQVTVCFREAGFSELANAIWQINLEANFLRKKSEQQPNAQDRASKLRELQYFWESDTLRVGEDRKAEGLHSTNLNLLSTQSHSNPISGITIWATLENQASSISSLSSRVDVDSDEVDDPFRVVLFSDIRSSIVCATSEIERQRFINAFLLYFRLPVISLHSDPNNSHLKLATFRRGEGMIVSNLNALSTESSSLRQLTNDYQLDDTILFADAGSWFSPFDHTEEWNNWSSWGRHALRRLVVDGICSESLVEYLLGWELHSDPQNARSIAKKALKRHPSSLRLYNAYAQIEARTGSYGAAANVLKAVLESEKHHRDTILLQRTWIWLLIDAGDYTRGLAKLIEFSLGTAEEVLEQQSNATAILQARKAISTEVNRLVSEAAYEEATYHIEVGVLLEYLASSLASALSSFETFRSLFPPKVHRTRPDELLHQFRARLVYKIHQIGGDLSSIKPRDVLLPSINDFPQNPIFLSVLERMDPWVGIHDRLYTIMSGIRDPLRSAAQKQNSTDRFITPHLYAIRRGIRRHGEGNSTVHAIRNLFERAIGSDPGLHCSVLWRSYCIFESKSGDTKSTRQVFFRAIRACPWVKDIYMMAFNELATAMSTDDLRSVYELLEEKELRIRVPLDQSLMK